MTDTYKVQRGDNLWNLARRFDTSVRELAQVNELDNPRFLRVGQRLRIPGEHGSDSLPSGQLERGEHGKGVRTLQEALVELGHLSDKEMASGPGIFGPRTEKALEEFQRKHGLKPTGEYGPKERAALKSALEKPEPKPEPKPQPKPEPKPEPRPDPKPTNWVAKAEADPNSLFKQQYRSRFNPTGPARSGNCGPASLAMAVKGFGLEPKGLSVEQSIDRSRKAMTGNTDDHDPTNPTEWARGAKKLGLKTDPFNRGELDAQLAKGRMCMLVGRPVGDYRDGFKNYADFTGYHSILVVAKTSKGYLVADPLSRTGTVTLSPAEMRDYWSKGGGSGVALWR